MSRPAGPDRLPLCAKGLQLRVEPVKVGRLAPAIRLMVYGGRQPTSVGATIPAAQAGALAAAIAAAGRRATAQG